MGYVGNIQWGLTQKVYGNMGDADATNSNYSMI